MRLVIEMKETKIEMKRSKETNQSIETRINKIIGQLKGIRRMSEEGVSYDELLIQLSSAEHATRSLSSYILEDYLTNLIDQNDKIKTKKEMKELIDLYKKFNQK